MPRQNRDSVTLVLSVPRALDRLIRAHADSRHLGYVEYVRGLVIADLDRAGRFDTGPLDLGTLTAVADDDEAAG